MLQADRLAYCFSLTHEVPDVEFKGRGKGRDNPLFGRVVRAAMVMANRRSGGIVIIGVEEDQNGLHFLGLTSEQLATWKYESIASGFNSFTNVPIEFDRLEYEYAGNTFLVLDIHEFATVPVMCMKEYRDKSNPKMPEAQCPLILRPGAFYIRTLNNAESKQMLTSEEARTLFELVADKAIQSFVTHTKLAGIDIAPLPKDEELFAQQLEGWTSPLLEDIRTRGYWDIRIRPVTFEPERVSLFQMRQLLVDASLDNRGWEFPFNTSVLPETGVDWIGWESRKKYNVQAWRFFQSGQFAAEVGLLDDWDEKRPYPLGTDATTSKLLATSEVIFRLTETFGLASRLAITDVYRDERSVVVDLRLCHVQDRQLYGRGIHQIPSPLGYRTSAETIPHPPLILAKEDIIARPRELALEATQYIFERFGWNPSVQLLATIQSELRIHS